MTTLLLNRYKVCMCYIPREFENLQKVLCNRYVSTNSTLEIEFNMPVTIDIVDTRYKIYKLSRRVRLTESSINSNTRELSNNKIECLYKKK